MTSLQHLVSRWTPAIDPGAPPSWVEPAARAGYAAKGAVYLVLGVLSVMAAVGVSGGRTGGASEALHEIGAQPFGRVLLALLAIGLTGYAVWRFVQAGYDTEREGKDIKGLFRRVGYALSGVIYGSLAIAALQLLAGEGPSHAESTWIAMALTEDWSRIALGIVGIGVICAGLEQLREAYTAKFRRDLRTHQMSSRELTVATWTGRIGLAARGLVMPMLGYYLLLAAYTARASEAKDVGGILDEIREVGALPLALMAFGLAAYGAFQLVLARYRGIRTS